MIHKNNKHEKDFCRAKVYFLLFLLLLLFFCGLVLTDFTDFEIFLIVLSKLIHTNIWLEIFKTCDK